ncbi:MAG: hypothetical protein ABFQ62_00365 [Patescibacteria group bacterium]
MPKETHDLSKIDAHKAFYTTVENQNIAISQIVQALLSWEFTHEQAKDILADNEAMNRLDLNREVIDVLNCVNSLKEEIIEQMEEENFNKIANDALSEMIRKMIQISEYTGSTVAEKEEFISLVKDSLSEPLGIQTPNDMNVEALINNIMSEMLHEARESKKTGDKSK